MKKETKEKIKETASVGGGSVMGAAAGVGIVSALKPEEASAQELGEPEKIEAEKPAAEHQTPTTSHTNPSRPTAQPVAEETKPIEEPKPEEPKEEEKEDDNKGDEIEVLGYERITGEDGQQMDMAIINDHGEEIAIIDVDLDGKADIIMSDVNHDGTISDDEIQVVQNMDISMLPLQEAAGFNPLYAENNLPDYVNDADVDTYTV